MGFMKFSLETLQANAPEGKNPHLLLSPNRDEPSARPVRVNMYLSLKI